MNSALIALEAQVRADLAKTAHPDAAWLTPKFGPDDRPALDVAVQTLALRQSLIGGSFNPEPGATASQWSWFAVAAGSGLNDLDHPSLMDH